MFGPIFWTKLKIQPHMVLGSLIYQYKKFMHGIAEIVHAMGKFLDLKYNIVVGHTCWSLISKLIHLHIHLLVVYVVLDFVSLLIFYKMMFISSFKKLNIIDSKIWQKIVIWWKNKQIGLIEATMT